MIDLVGPLQLIDALDPGTIDLALGALPDIAPALDLATQLGANPGPLLDAFNYVTNNRELLAGIVAAATPLFSAATADLFTLGQDYLTNAARILPGLFAPFPGSQAGALAELAALTGATLLQAQQRVARLEQELVPDVAKLHGIGADPLPQLPAEVPPPEQPSAVPAATPTSPTGGDSAQGEAAVAAAMTQLGTPYVWGGTTPGAGFDCSGFTQWAWRQAGVELPRLAEEQTVGRPVAHHELQAGDLAVWDGHVAMYDGQGYLIEAGDPVSRNPLRETNMGMTFKGYYRPTG